MEMRRKAEGSLQDTKDQLQTEISTRVMMSSSTQHANEKNMQLDKHVRYSQLFMRTDFLLQYICFILCIPNKPKDFYFLSCFTFLCFQIMLYFMYFEVNAIHS